MYSDSVTRKTRTLSISLIMLVSALAPLAAPVSATTNVLPNPLTLEMDDDGTWVGVPHYSDPMIDGFMDAGTYEFRFTSMNLTSNDNYSLEWMAAVCEFNGDCSEPVDESRSWTAMSDSSSEHWNLTLGIMDCDVEIYANLMNETSGDEWSFSWEIYGPCGNSGDITLEIDLDGDGTDESVDGFEFDQTPSLDPGNYDASFDVANLSSTGSYSMMWNIFSETGPQDGQDDNEWMSNWTGTDPGTLLDFDFEVLPMTCGIWIEAMLMDNGPGEAIGAFVTMMTGPCIDPVTVSVWDEDSGEWIELNDFMESEFYLDCVWSDHDTRWWCGEDYDGDGELDSTDEWWFYCEESEHDGEEGWLCTDSFGQSEDHEFTENNTLLVPTILDEGVYDVMVNLTALNTSTHYAVLMDNLDPGYLEFNSTSENYSITAELEVSPYDCDTGIYIGVWDDLNNFPNEFPTMRGGAIFFGPCEEQVSPFTLTYDGSEYEPEYYHMEYDDCTDTDGHWECEFGYDTDGDGVDDEYDYHHYEYDDCEWSEDDMLWYCIIGWMSPNIEEGNHTMELLVEGLEVGEDYSVDIYSEVGGKFGYYEDQEFHNFTATAVNETIVFYVETDNFTCNLQIGTTLLEINDDGYADEMFWDLFDFYGPCQEPPSPFTLTYDGMEWEMDYYHMEYDDCTDMDGHWECEYGYDTDGDGVDDEYDYHYYEYDDCEWSEDDMLWHCITGWMPPHIEEGNHTMELLVEGLEVGEDYSVDIETQDCTYMGQCEWDYESHEFTATAENETIEFYFETHNSTCNAHVRADLMTEDDEGGWNHMGHGMFNFHGPCEQPPSPFSLTYDGMEWEMDYHHMEYDDCTDMDGHWECEYGYDYDGDGVDDEYDYHYYEYDDCEWSEDDMLWYCIHGEMPPHIEEGNYTMVLTVEGLEVGMNYSVDWNTYICVTTMEGCDHDGDSFEFNATAEEMSETFYLEVNNQTCSIEISVSLYVMEYGHGYQSWLGDDRFGFHGPCEQPPSPFSLTYDDMEWEMDYNHMEYDDCTDSDGLWECEYGYDYDGDGVDDEYDYHYYEYDDCEWSEDDMLWHCIAGEMPPHIEEGNHTMELLVEGLEVGENYYVDIETGDWGMMNNEWHSESHEFTATAENETIEFYFETDNSTCNAHVRADLMTEDDEGGWGHMGHGMFMFSGPCEWEWPVDITLEVDDNGWQEVDDIPFSELMEVMEDDEDEGPGSDEMADFILSNIGYELSEGTWTMSWTMDDLDVDGDYEFGWNVDIVPGDEDDDDEDDDEPTFYCGNGDEIPFGWVNDGYEDCPDGADEQQYDDNGDPINWFDCSDGSEVWIYQVNDGYEDCPDGDDEWYYEDEHEGDHEYDWNHNFTATSDSESLEWELEATEDACLIAVQGDLMSIEEHDDGWTETHMVGMFIAYILGPWAEEDENDDGIPDCLEMLFSEDFGDGDGEGFDMRDFFVGQDFSAELIEVVDSDGTAVAAIHQHTTLDDEIRMKIDFDFFDGDGILNDTEAAMFEMQYIEGTSEEGCSEEQVPPFTMNGVEPWCATNHVWFDNLANNSDGHSPVMMQGWDLHYNVTVNDEGQMIFHYPGDIVVWGEDTDSLDFDGSLCGGAHDGAGLVVASWSYNGTEMTGNCVEVMAGDYIEEIQIVFGYPDSDGDGYNDFEDRFPDDPEEWSDLDDDGVGDNHDAFPNDPTETWDADGDGVGDNGDAFPWDASESADSDGDGWGDNSDAFPDDSTEWVDTDGDGVGDNADTDADNDGTDDTDEDSDGDGVNDDQDDFPFDANETTDTDGDGIGDNGDDFPNDSNETTDTDGDGIGDNSDDDADGDGTPNDLDDFPLNDAESTDSDGDGVGDSEDAFPNNPNEYIDSDGDGVGDNADTDDDNDGTPDTSDVFPLDPSETSDTDGDGYGDVADAFPNDAGEWSDYDGDGVGDNSDAFMSDPYESRDSDGDGVGDNADWAPNDPNEILDSDGDGVGNNADAFPTDASESKDTDDDGIGDNADDDADGDGIPDDGIDPVDDGESGGILPGFTAITGLASVLGAAILVAGRRKD